MQQLHQELTARTDEKFNIHGRKTKIILIFHFIMYLDAKKSCDRMENNHNTMSPFPSQNIFQIKPPISDRSRSHGKKIRFIY